MWPGCICCHLLRETRQALRALKKLHFLEGEFIFPPFLSSTALTQNPPATSTSLAHRGNRVSNMTAVDVNDFSQERQSTNEGERYCVRDNGAVFRYQPEGKRARANDNQWTFGKENSSNPYLHISNIRVHRIVAIAFHGEPP